ncbi:MAG: cysteine synthase A [Tissierellia bacterium]|nr:cysteine synthase A [Tissierellia bacterium]
MIYNNILETIGRTPIVKINSANSHRDVEILAKIESFNPGGSIKDRAALEMILDAEKSGKLKKGGSIIEPTSGNTGIAIAMVGAAKGYKVILVMPDSMSIERRKLIKAYGAEIILTDGSLGMKGAVDKAEEEAMKNGYFMPYQFKNPANTNSHIKTTALEIIRDIGNDLNYFVAGVGTGGTLSGIGRVLKENNENIRIIAVEPEESKVLRGEKANSHGIQGIGANFIPDIYESKYVDDIMPVKTEDAIKTARELASKEGILCGISSGANICACLKLAKNMASGRILTVLPDTGERYLSTVLFEEE